MNMRIHIDGVTDSINALGLFKTDSSTSVIAQRLTVQTIARVVQYKYTESKLTAGGLVSIQSNVNPAADAFRYSEEDWIENSQDDGIIAEDAEDIPTVELLADEHTRPIVTMGKAFAWTRHEVRRAEFQAAQARAQGGRSPAASLIEKKASKCRMAHDRDMARLIAFGHKATGLQGMFNFKGLHRAKASADWTDGQAVSDADLEKEFNAKLTEMQDGVPPELRPNTILFGSYTLWRRLTTTFIANQNLTLLDRLKAANPGITRWDWEMHLEKAGTGKKPAMYIYRRDPDVSYVEVPEFLVPLPAERKGQVFKVPMLSRFGGFIPVHPIAHRLVEGIAG